MSTPLDIIINAVDNASGVIGGVTGALGNMATLAGGAAVAGIGAATAAVVGSIGAFNDWTGTLDGLGDVLGTTADESAAITVAIEGVGGNVEAITGQMAKMTNGMVDSEGGLSKTGQLLAELGVSAFETGGKVVDLASVISPKQYGEMADEVSKASAKLADMQTKFDAAKVPTVAMNEALQEQKAHVEAMQTAYDAAGKSVVDLSETAMLPAGDIMKSVADKINLMPDGLEKSKLMMELFGKSGKDMTDTLAALGTEGLDAAAQKAKDYGLAVGDEGVNASVEMGKAQAELGLMLKGLAVQIGAEVLPALLPLAQQFIALAREHLPPILDALRSFGGVIVSVAGQIQAFVTSEGFVAFLKEAGEVAGTVFEGIKSVVERVWPSIQRIINLIGGIIKTVFGEAGADSHALQDTVTVVFDVIGTVIGTALDLIEGILKTAMALFKGIFKGDWGEMQKIVDQIWAAIKTAINDALTSIGKAITDQFTQIGESLKALPAKFAEFARNAMQGFIDGLKSMKDQLIEGFIASLPGALQATIREILRLGSPSQLFYGYGKNVMEGFAMGIADNAGLPRIALQGVAQMAIQPVGARAIPTNQYNMRDTVNVYGTQNVAAEIARARQEATRQVMLRAQVGA